MNKQKNEATDKKNKKKYAQTELITIQKKQIEKETERLNIGYQLNRILV